VTDLSTLLRLQQDNGITQPVTLADIIKVSGGGNAAVFLGGDGAFHSVSGGGDTRVASVSTTTYTFALIDDASYLRFSNASPVTATVPPHSSVAFGVGATITVEQSGAGLLTIAAGAGVTVNTQTTLKMAGQYAVASLICVATDVWTLAGNLATS
jgi:hypothetical protein